MDVIVILLLLLFGYLFLNQFKKKVSENNYTNLGYLFIYHFFFGIYYCFFVKGDAIGYWGSSKKLTYEEFVHFFKNDKGTYFVRALNYFPAKVLDLSYFSGTMIYTLIGFVGLTYFYLIAIELIPKNSKVNGYYLFPLLFFLPNLHFWSCAVGKDSLLFLCIALFSYGLLTPIKRINFIVIGLVLSYFIRPHITLFMLLGFGFAYFSGNKLSFFQRVVFFGSFIGIAFLILPLVLKFSKIEEASLDAFQEFSTTKVSLLSRSHTGSAINISNSPIIVKVFSFLFRPFVFDINSFPSLLAATENSILLFLTIKWFSKKSLESFRNAPFLLQGMIYFLLLGTFAFSQSLGNLGIMIRMRNMFLPGLIIFFLWHFSYIQNEKLVAEEEQ
ncbi:MAG: hypothetical protein K9I35_07225 [Flavobacterium sp.]|nr:hypothetical protein [Flavobacterium sp.]